MTPIKKKNSAVETVKNKIAKIKKVQPTETSKSVQYTVTFRNGSKVFYDKTTAENYAEVVNGVVTS